jgi:hypothetical protein
MTPRVSLAPLDRSRRIAADPLGVLLGVVRADDITAITDASAVAAAAAAAAVVAAAVGAGAGMVTVPVAVSALAARTARCSMSLVSTERTGALARDDDAAVSPLSRRSPDIVRCSARI